MIFHNKDNGNFYFEDNIHLLVTVTNQDIFNVEREIGLYFFANYNKSIFINLVMNDIEDILKKNKKKSEPWRELNLFK